MALVKIGLVTIDTSCDFSNVHLHNPQGALTCSFAGGFKLYVRHLDKVESE